MIAKQKNGYLEDMHDRWISPKTREIWIHGVDSNVDCEYDGEETGVEYMMANKVIKNLHYLLHQSRRSPVTIHMKSCGGVFEEGMAIYDTIKAMPYKVKIISYTHARSMSSIILQAADERIILPSSYFMFHYGTLFVSGVAQQVHSAVDFSKKCDDKMMQIYVDSCKNSVKFKDKTDKQIHSVLKKQMNEKVDVFLTAEETIEWGFADSILDRF